MTVTLGKKDATDATGWTTFTVPATVFYVSDSIGNVAYDGLYPDNSGGGSQGPKKTIAQGIALLTSGAHEEWLLLKKGDTFANQSFGDLTGYHGVSAAQPRLFSSYDPAYAIGTYGPNPAQSSLARPLVYSDGTVDPDCKFGSGNYIAFTGLEFYDRTNDPHNVGNGYLTSTTLDYGIQVYAYVTWWLVEDCKFSYYIQPLMFQANLNAQDGIIVRRNVIVDSFNREGASWGLGVSGTNCVVEENLFDHNGWSEYFTDVPVSISGTAGNPIVVTYASNILANDDEISFRTGGGNINTGIYYYVVSNGVDGAGKFRISTTVGGSAVNIAGGEPASPHINWNTPSEVNRTRAHNIYLNQDAPYQPITFYGNICSNDASGSKAVGGGDFQNNLFFNNPYAITYGYAAGGAASFKNNVVQDATALYLSSGYWLGVQFDSAYNGYFLNTGTIDVSGNIISHTTANTQGAFILQTGVVNANVLNNIIYNWNPTPGSTPAIVKDETGILTFKNIRGGSGYASGGTHTYDGVVLTGGTGSGVTASITVTSGVVTSVTVYAGVIGSNLAYDGNFGTGYLSSDTNLTTSNTNLGNSGSGFLVDVGTLTVDTTTPNTIDATASNPGAFPAPARTVATYDSEVLGGPGTSAHFITLARAQSKANWNYYLTANAVNRYIRDGFAIYSHLTSVLFYRLGGLHL